MEKKYELTDETITIDGHTLYRIKSLKDFNYVKKGDLGGFIENEKNLSHKGNCWVYDSAVVFGNAEIYGNAKVYDSARVYGNAKVRDRSLICNNAKVYGDVQIYGKSNIFGNAKIFGNAQVCGEVLIYDNAEVYNKSKVCDNAKIFGDAKVFGNARIFGKAIVFDNSEVHGRAKVFDCSIYGYLDICDIIEISNVRLGEQILLQGDAIIKSYSDIIFLRKFWTKEVEYIVYTRSNNMFSCENFYGTEEEFIKYELDRNKENGVNCSLFIEFIKMIRYGKEV